MASTDPFGFGEAATDADASVDLEAFAPKAKPVDREAAKAASAVAQDAGFSRRSTKAKDAEPEPAPAPAATLKGARRRIPISQVIGYEDRYPDTERAQLNVLAPVPVVLRWRELVKGLDTPAWAVLEKAMDALSAQAGELRRGAG